MGEHQQLLLERLRKHLLLKPGVTMREDYDVAQIITRITGRFLTTHEHHLLWGHITTAWRELGDETWLYTAALSWWLQHLPHEVRGHSLILWERWFITILDQVAIPLGIIAKVGIEEHATLHLTPAGRWALGLDAAWTAPVATNPAKPVIVQADHTIIFLAPEAALEVAIGAFTERLPGAHSTGALFKLSKQACRRAATAGLDAAHIVQVLAQASAKALPANVVREVEGWFGRLRRGVMQTVLLITTTNEETANALVTVLGAVRVGPLAVSLPANTSTADLEKKMAKEDILLVKSTA